MDEICKHLCDVMHTVFRAGTLRKRKEHTFSILFLVIGVRGMFFNSCHLLGYFSCGQATRLLFICGESSIFSGQIGINIIALWRTVIW